MTQIDLKLISKNDLVNIEREIKFHQKIDHPNIIRFYDYYKKDEENKVLILLEYAENGDLFNFLNRRGPLDEATACKFFVQTALALNYIHSFKMIHRDVKPENILLDGNKNAKLCDFGWSAEFDEGTKRQTVCGTYEYMAPEILFKKQQDTAIDVWALGILLYELLHNKAPYSGRSLGEVSRKIAAGNIEFDPRTPADAKELVLQILKRDPKERPPINKILQHAFVVRTYGRIEESQYSFGERKDCYSGQQSVSATTGSQMLDENLSPTPSPLPVRGLTFAVDQQSLRGSGFQPVASHTAQAKPQPSFQSLQNPQPVQAKKPATPTPQLTRAQSLNPPPSSSFVPQQQTIVVASSPLHKPQAAQHSHNASLSHQLNSYQPLSVRTSSENISPAQFVHRQNQSTQQTHYENPLMAKMFPPKSSAPVDVQQAANKYGKPVSGYAPQTYQPLTAHHHHHHKENMPQKSHDQPFTSQPLQQGYSYTSRPQNLSVLQPVNHNSAISSSDQNKPQYSRLAMNNKLNSLKLKKVISDQPAIRVNASANDKEATGQAQYSIYSNGVAKTEANYRQNSSTMAPMTSGRTISKQNSFDFSNDISQQSSASFVKQTG